MPTPADNPRDHALSVADSPDSSRSVPTESARSRGRVGAFLKLVAIEHSVFALPFAYLSALTAMTVSGGRVRWLDLLLITVAMVGARTFAMAANRILDRKIDARNPRTANRELVTGAVSLRTAWTGAGVALAVFLAAAALLNPLCLVLAPLAVVPLIVYPYGKRFTNWPHAILGVAQMVGPVGAWLGVTGTFAGSGPAWLLGVAVGLWIGGFDLIYACQDAEVDRKIGVHSVPARYGLRFALHASTVAHVVTFALFLWFGVLVGFGWLWWIGLALTAVAFGYQHLVVTPTDLSRVNRAFFTANGFVGIALFLFALLDLVVRLGLRP
ncbi:4-hydroxybenzoate octaprenyltransferase [Micromonospora endophytica]|uniref:menaquinone biosynthesis prenyltransferase MqnP n=1 Tax=Micromonospora endophytica TaxID=515350 RepID=UPI000E689AB2|nr:menaquinone biosynthesis prenyltransferase MqnP [Micromonospora endophytica]RIW49146.1 4-hydroxybenzoate octaprenyltransferase [Micromonospora endophytica]BCJ59092.1 4-hydroxybenzoate octaprenyltransferase [Micromonospora endophytica]